MFCNMKLDTRTEHYGEMNRCSGILFQKRFKNNLKEWNQNDNYQLGSELNSIEIIEVLKCLLQWSNTMQCQNI